MRALSAIAFVISLLGLLVVCYNQFAIIPFLQNLYSPDTKTYDLSIKMTNELEDTHYVLSIISLITGVFSVVFCSLLYLRKKTRMTFVGTFIGFVVTVISIIHLF